MHVVCANIFGAIVLKPDRPGRSPTHSRARASRHVSIGVPEVAAAQRKSREHGSDADSGRRAATPVAR